MSGVLRVAATRRLLSSRAHKLNQSTQSRSTPADYCLDMVRRHDHENFLCSLLLPKRMRDPAFAVRALNIEVAKVADQARETATARMRINFWQQTVDQVCVGNPPQHPVALELSRVLSECKLMKRNLKRLIAARNGQISGTGFQSLDKMEEYAEETVSPVYYLLLEAAGIKNVECDHAASHLGKAQGLVTLVRAVPHLARRRELLLPHDLLAKHNVPHEAVLRAQTSKGLGDAIFEIASRAKLHLDKARSLKKDVSKDASALFLPAIAVDAFLERLRRTDFDIFNSKLHERNSSLGWKLFWSKVLSRY